MKESIPEFGNEEVNGGEESALDISSDGSDEVAATCFELVRIRITTHLLFFLIYIF